MLAVLLVAPFLGLDNFAVSVALGLQRACLIIQLYVVVLFGTLAALAIVLGSTIGSASTAWLGPSAQYLGGAILAALCAYQLWHERGASKGLQEIHTSVWSLFAIGVGVSIDTIVAGVAFGMRGDSIPASALAVGCVTAVLSFAGLELGGWIGHWTKELNSRIAPAVLVIVGLGIAGGVL